MIHPDNFIITCAKQAVKITHLEEALEALQHKISQKNAMITQLEKEADEARDSFEAQEQPNG